MILVDTSIWVEHLRKGIPELASLLNKTEIVCHPFIIGELSCGNLKNRKQLLLLLKDLPQVIIAAHDEVLTLIESRNLMGHGVGWVDSHLLASALLSNCPLWTADKKLRSLAAALGVLY